MTITPSLPRIEEHRVPVVFDCPHCGGHVRGTAYDLRETVRFTNRVPRWGWQSHWVRCSNCQTELHANCGAEQLSGKSPTTVNEHLRAYLSFPRRFLAIASLMLCWTPVVGVLLAAASTVACVRTRGWPRWVSVIGLILAIGINIAMFAAVSYAWSRANAPMS